MSRFLYLVSLLFPCISFAQSNFTQKLQESKDGAGKVEIVEESRLTRLVNGDSIVPEPSKKKEETTIEQKGLSPQDEHSSKERDSSETNVTNGNESASVEPHVMKIRRYKISGYRVQIYSGNNSRKSRIEATKTAQRFKGYYPEVPAYTHFYPPHWVCRVGDFKTASQAQSFLNQLRKLKVFSGLIVVKTAIQVSVKSEPTL